MPSIKSAGMLLSLLLAMPAAALAQAKSPAAAEEIAVLQQKLGDLQARVMKNAEVQAAQAEVSDLVAAAIMQTDSMAKAKFDRAQVLQAELTDARAKNDTTKFKALAQEAAVAQSYFAELRKRAMASPQVLAARQKFLALVLAKMNEADPKASAWVARLEQLQGAAMR